MRILALQYLLLSSFFVVYGAPPTFSEEGSIQAVFTEDLTGARLNFSDHGRPSFLKAKNGLEIWNAKGKEFTRQNGLLYEFYSHPEFQSYNLRIAEPKLCDPSVKQYSGYLDVAENKHLFFWFFESRVLPAEAPLILWLNGGPGCSSSTGLLFELGPCSIEKDGKSVKHNPWGWNSNANIIFLDQPATVGFSYTDDGKHVFTTSEASKDFYAFLQLFFGRFPEYSKSPFHFAGESYGGTYLPNFSKVIFNANKDLSLAPNSRLKHINLASIIIGNGLTEPYTQFGSMPEQICNGPYPVYDDPNGPECKAFKAKVSVCQRLIKLCYKFESKLACAPAHLYCFDGVFRHLAGSGKNVYDARRKCDPAKDGPLCYKELVWMEAWMNDPDNKAALGVDPNRKFASCNDIVTMGFAVHGDGMHNSATLLPELVDAGVKLLVYNGNADMLCNPVGSEQWVERLPTRLSSEFSKSKARPWIIPELGIISGQFRSAGGEDLHAGNITFVNVFQAGHMVPYDQPIAALDLINRWINNRALTSFPSQGLDIKE